MCVLQRNLRSEKEKEKRKREKKMAKQVRFNDKVSKRCNDNVESCPLAEEDEVAARTYDFRGLVRTGI